MYLINLYRLIPILGIFSLVLQLLLLVVMPVISLEDSTFQEVQEVLLVFDEEKTTQAETEADGEKESSTTDFDNVISEIPIWSEPEPEIINLDQEKLQKKVLDLHNEFRGKHGAPMLKLNQQLSESSLKWAVTLAENENVTFKHSFDLYPDLRFGENIYAGWGKTYPINLLGSLGTEWWYNEIRFYDFDNPAFSYETSHFTQLIWKKSRELGVASVTNKFGHSYLVCQYKPQGNIFGQFKENVPRLLLSSSENDFENETTTIMFKSNQMES